MEASQPRPHGSFGIPEAVRRQMEESKKKQAAPKGAPSPNNPATEEQIEQAAAAVEKKLEESDKPQEESRVKEILETKAHWESQLEVKITAQDVRDYIFQGKVEKDKVFVASLPSKENPEELEALRVTFRSHTPEDMSAIDEKIAAFRDRGKFTQNGLDNEQALLVLSHGLIKINGSALGKTPEERYANIKKLGSHLVDLIVDSWRGFNILLRLALQEKKLLKK